MILSCTSVHTIRAIIVPAPINGNSVRMARAQRARKIDAMAAPRIHQYGLPSGPKNVIMWLKISFSIVLL